MIVKEYKTPSGVTVRFHDSAYKGKTEEEKERLRRNVNETITIFIQKELQRKNEVLYETRRARAAGN